MNEVRPGPGHQHRGREPGPGPDQRPLRRCGGSGHRRRPGDHPDHRYPSTTRHRRGRGSPTEPVEPAVLSGVVFLDVDGDGDRSNPMPKPPGSTVAWNGSTVAVTVGDQVETVVTGPDGSWSIRGCPRSGGHRGSTAMTPRSRPVSSSAPTTSINSWNVTPGQECNATPIGFEVNLRPIEDITAQVIAEHPIADSAVKVLAAAARDDVIRAALGEPLHLDQVIRTATLNRDQRAVRAPGHPRGATDDQGPATVQPPLRLLQRHDTSRRRT